MKTIAVMISTIDPRVSGIRAYVTVGETGYLPSGSIQVCQDMRDRQTNKQHVRPNKPIQQLVLNGRHRRPHGSMQRRSKP
jgi:hypothetical protein